jgi:hypothetical protein
MNRTGDEAEQKKLMRALRGTPMKAPQPLYAGGIASSRGHEGLEDHAEPYLTQDLSVVWIDK